MQTISDMKPEQQRARPRIECPKCRGIGTMTWRSPFGYWDGERYRRESSEIECDMCEGNGVIVDRRVADRRRA